jgi:hypothetical protein
MKRVKSVKWVKSVKQDTTGLSTYLTLFNPPLSGENQSLRRHEMGLAIRKGRRHISTGFKF